MDIENNFLVTPFRKTMDERCAIIREIGRLFLGWPYSSGLRASRVNVKESHHG